MRPLMHHVYLEGWPIYKQLQLEEALLRVDNRNWCLINQGSDASIVMGISGKAEQLIHQHNDLPLIRRFSGGGTVVVDHNTLFVTFICNSEEFGIPCFPKEVMRWTEKVYQPVFEGLNFSLRENDYVMGERKFGGNAQYLQKKRWLHHSTLLWDFDSEKMRLLKMPPKTPEYRKARDHSDFLCTLKEHFDHPQVIVERILQSLQKEYDVTSVSQDKILEIMSLPHRKGTILVSQNYLNVRGGEISRDAEIIK